MRHDLKERLRCLPRPLRVLCTPFLRLPMPAVKLAYLFLYHVMVARLTDAPQQARRELADYDRQHDDVLSLT